METAIFAPIRNGKNFFGELIRASGGTACPLGLTRTHWMTPRLYGMEAGSMDSNEKKYWFPAKRYGWGWGLPNCWQGWVVLAVWFAFLLGGMWLLKSNPAVFAAYVVLLGIVLTVIGLLKGEKTHWRWGDKEKK